MISPKWKALKVEDIMHRDVRQVDPDMRLADAAGEMRDMDVGCLVVWEGDELIGIVTDRDITCRATAERHDPATTTVREIMSKDVTCCFDDQGVDKAAHIMEENKVRRLPVFDHDSHMVGILTLSDLSANSPELTGQVVRAVTPHH